MSVELLNCVRVNVLVKVRRRRLWRLLVHTLLRLGMLGLLLNPQSFWRLEIVSEDADDLLDLVICVCVDKEI